MTSKTWLLTGVITGILMIAWFLFCRFAHIAFITGLHFVNIIFVAIAVWYVTRRHRFANPDYPYLSGMLEGVKTAIIAGALSNFFLTIYLRFIDKSFMAYLHDYAPLGEYMSPIIIALVLFTEQICAAVIVAMIVLQLYKTTST